MTPTTNLQNYKFIKEDTGKWYIDLPEWTGQKADLEMVAGADTMLDYVGEGNDPDGKIIAKDLYGDDLLKTLEALVK